MQSLARKLDLYVIFNGTGGYLTKSVRLIVKSEKHRNKYYDQVVHERKKAM